MLTTSFEKLLKNKPTYNNGKQYRYSITLDKNSIYLKFYYDEHPSQEDVDALYLYCMPLFEKKGYSFHGLTWYLHNSEVCFSYKKEV